MLHQFSLFVLFGTFFRFLLYLYRIFIAVTIPTLPYITPGKILLHITSYNNYSLYVLRRVAIYYNVLLYREQCHVLSSVKP